MTIGIYKLSFLGTTKVYIGQSLDIERRYLDHLRLMSKGLSSSKLNHAYFSFGKPNISILKSCNKEQLNFYEDAAILEFDSVKCGFNTLSESGFRSDSCGSERYNSLADKDTYLCILTMLALTNWKMQDIAEEVSISLSVIKDISRGHSHRYLQEEYPELYESAISKRGLRISGNSSAKEQGIEYPKVVSPAGIVYQVDNATQFAKLHKINIGNFNSLLNKNRLSANKWRLA